MDRGASTDTYAYDENGNMTCRVEKGTTYLQFYNAENRFSVAWLVSGTCAEPGTTLAAWAFTYDGDGTRVKQVYTDGSGTLTTYYFFGGAYEVRTDGSTTDTLTYYSFGGQTFLRDAGGLKYLLTDHLGSVVAVTDASGALLSQTRYLPYGGVRDDVGTITQTDYGYTGQRALDAQITTYKLGLIDYHARFYDGALMRFIQPDSIIPNLNPQSLNRFSYGLNNPSRYTDPTGHMVCNVMVSGSSPVDEDACESAQRNRNPDYVGPLDYQKPGLPVHVHRTIYGNAENLGDLLELGHQHAAGATITGEGLQSLQDDPSVQAAQDRIITRIRDNPKYGEQSFFIESDYENFTANGPSGIWWKGALKGNPAFWMVHTATLYATNTTVSGDGTISTTWKLEDSFDYTPAWNDHDRTHWLAYNLFAAVIHPFYNGLWGAVESFPTNAYWDETISP